VEIEGIGVPYKIWQWW